MTDLTILNTTETATSDVPSATVSQQTTLSKMKKEMNLKEFLGDMSNTVSSLLNAEPKDIANAHFILNNLGAIKNSRLPSEPTVNYVKDLSYERIASTQAHASDLIAVGDCKTFKKYGLPLSDFYDVNSETSLNNEFSFTKKLIAKIQRECTKVVDGKEVWNGNVTINHLNIARVQRNKELIAAKNNTK